MPQTGKAVVGVCPSVIHGWHNAVLAYKKKTRNNKATVFNDCFMGATSGNSFKITWTIKQADTLPLTFRQADIVCPAKIILHSAAQDSVSLLQPNCCSARFLN